MKKQTKRFLAKIMTIVMLCSLITFPVNATVSDGAVTIDKTATELNLDDRTGTVELNVKGNITDKPVDVVLVLDVSNSMNKNDRLQALKNASNAFVDRVLFTGNPGNRIGIVAYSTEVKTQLAFNADKGSVKSAIESLYDDKDTNMQGGLFLGKALLGEAKSGSEKALVFMSDGKPNEYLRRGNYSKWEYDYRIANPVIDGKPVIEYWASGTSNGWKTSQYNNSVVNDSDNADDRAIAEAALIANSGVPIYSVGLATDSVADAVLRSIGSSGGYYKSPTNDDLDDMFRKISERVSVVGTNVSVTDTVPDYLEVIENSFKINGALAPAGAVSQSGNVITWNLNKITRATDILTYEVRAKSTNHKYGRLNTNVEAVLNYTPAGATTPAAPLKFPVPNIYVRPYSSDFSYTATAGEPKTIAVEEFVLDTSVNEYVNNSGGLHTFDSLDYTIIDDSNLHGTLTKNADGSFVYTADETYSGDATFTYKTNTVGKFGEIQTTLSSDIKTVTFAVVPPTKYGLTVTAPENSYTLASNPSQTGSPYKAGTIVTAVAKDITGKVFTGWSGDVDSDYSEGSKTATVTMNDHKAITATYTPQKVTLNVTEVGGHVTRNPDNTNGIYDYGTTVELEATPNPGYTFTGWSGEGLSGSETQNSILMNGNKNITATFEKQDVTLTLSGVNGTLVPLVPHVGAYKYGDVVELVRTPADNYHFDKWTGDSVTELDGKFTITLNGSKNVKAWFAPDAYTLTYGVVGMGTADSISVATTIPTVEGEYVHGSVVTLTATDQPGISKFEGWARDKDGTQLLTKEDGAEGNVLTVTMTGPYTVYALITPLHNLSVTNTGNGSGSVKLNDAVFTDGKFVEGTTVTLSAQAAEDSEFIGWNGGTDTTALSVVMDGKKDVTAEFRLKQYTLSLGTSGEGMIDKVTKKYDHGSEVTVTATPNDNNQFIGWYEGTLSAGSTVPTYGSEPVTKNEELKVTMLSNKIYEARFALNQHTITTGKTGVGSGTVTGGGTFDYGSKATLTAEAAEGSRFNGWTITKIITGEKITQADSTIDVIVDANKKAVAEFVSTYELTVLVTGNDGMEGSVTTITDKAPINGRYDHDSAVTLTAHPKEGWDFKEWIGVDSSNGETASVRMTSSKDVEAVFELEQYILTLTPIDKEFGRIDVSSQPNKDGKYIRSSDPMTVLAIPKTGYEFVSWEGTDKDSAGVNDSGTHYAKVTMTGDREVKAHFALKTYTLTHKSFDGNGTTSAGIVPETGSEIKGKYTHGSKIIVKAIPNPGYHLSKWIGDDQSTVEEINIEMLKDMEVIAVFEKDAPVLFPLSITTVGSGMVSTSVAQGLGGYPTGTEVVVTATPASGWQFAGWSGSSGSSSQSITMLMDSTKVLTATFTEIPAPPVTPPTEQTITRDKADPPVTNIPQERVPLGLPAVPAVKEEPVVALPEELIPMGVPVLPKTGETSSLFFYLLGLGLVGAGILGFRKKEMN